MKAEDSIIEHCRSANNFRVLLDDVEGRWTGKEKYIDGAAESFELDTFVLHNYIHPK